MPPEYKKLDSGEDFLVAAEDVGENEVLLVFMSSFGERVLRKSSTWLSDGTFKCVPAHFGQMYVVFGAKQDSPIIFPACYCLLPNKKYDTYLRMWSIIKSRLNISNDPQVVNIDFEAAAISAVKDVFPTTQVDGCNFHWKRCIFDNVGAKGCLSLFHNNDKFQIGIDLVYTLCYVPVDYIIQAWEDVIMPFFEKNFEDEHVEVFTFLTYVEATWIGRRRTRGNRSAPRFQHSMWNINSNIVEDRPTTNNAVESFNGRWNQSIGTSFNIWTVISKFKTEDSLARTKLQEMVTARRSDEHPARMEAKACRLKKLKDALENFDPDCLKEFMFGLRDNA